MFYPFAPDETKEFHDSFKVFGVAEQHNDNILQLMWRQFMKEFDVHVMDVTLKLHQKETSTGM